MKSKKSIVIEFVTSGKYKEALSICKSWNLPITKEESNSLRRGYECMTYPEFYRQLGYNIEDEIEQAISILKRLYEV